MDTTLLIDELLKAGITFHLYAPADGRAVYEFRDGFYKSDGFARIEVDWDGNCVFHARYGERAPVETLVDVVAKSHDWWLYSKDRFDGWSSPATVWNHLYEQFGYKCG